MTRLYELYRCAACGNILGVFNKGNGMPVCCGSPMQLLAEKTADEGREKHLPVITPAKGGIIVKLGSIPHPMEEDHFIEWIEVRKDHQVSIKGLKPGEAPSAFFCGYDVDVTARAYCNRHGLWAKKE